MQKSWRAVTAAGLGIALAASLSACGGGSSDSSDVTVKFLNYGDWVGKTEIADFEKSHPGVTIKQYALPEGGSSALAAQLAKEKGAYDLVAVGNATAARLSAGKLIAEFDAASVPNLTNIPQNYRDEFPWGVPTDLGKVGIIYNKAKVTNPPTTWKELFDRADDWSGKIVLPDYDLDVAAIALLSLGYDINTTDQGELAQAESAIKKIKSKLLAFQGSNRATSVADGSALLAVGYDYEYAGADNAGLGWISPTEGTPGYIEGVAVVQGSKHAKEALEFLNARLEPTTYAGLINNTGSSYLMPAAEKDIDQKILDNPALRQNDASPFLAEKFLSAEDTELRAKMWNRIKAS